MSSETAPPDVAVEAAAPPDSTHSSDDGEIVEEKSILIDVTKENFLEKSNDFIREVAKSAWIAIDEEMTGIQLPDTPRPRKDDSPADRYETLKAVPERYSLIQLGIALFQKAEKDSPLTINSNKVKFHVRRYKFTLFPPSDSSITREIVLSPGSVKFLAEDNNCNMNEWIEQGIPFCTVDVATRMLDRFREDQLARLTPNPTDYSSPIRRKIEITKTQDKDFMAQAMATLREWLDAALHPSNEGAYIMLPPCNSFLRRALYEAIPLEYPNLVLETMKQTNQIRVWRLSQAEKKARNIRLLKEGFDEVMLSKIGAWRIFIALAKACSGTGPQSQAEHMALSATADQALEAWDGGSSILAGERKPIPLVVHNGLQDLFFLLTHFHNEQLPENWVECKELIHSYFPIVYDTKTMATEYCQKENARSRTHLAAVYEQTLLSYPRWNRKFTMEGKPLEDAEQFHDAGYDAYCTGAAFCGLASTIQTQHREQQQQRYRHGNTVFPHLRFPWDVDPDCPEALHYYGRNKLHFFMSPYTIDLETAEDPLSKGMSKNSTFRLSGFSPSLTTRDIVRCLSGLVDESGNTVNFEIVWVNDTCVMVGAMIQQHLTATATELAALSKEHGKILWKTLKLRFPNETICTLDGSEDLDNEYGTGSKSSLWNLWGLLGGKKRSKNDDSEGPSNKRRRIQ